MPRNPPTRRLAMRCNLCGPCTDRMDEQGDCGPWARIEPQPADAYPVLPASRADGLRHVFAAIVEQITARSP